MPRESGSPASAVPCQTARVSAVPRSVFASRALVGFGTARISPRVGRNDRFGLKSECQVRPCDIHNWQRQPAAFLFERARQLASRYEKKSVHKVPVRVGVCRILALSQRKKCGSITLEIHSAALARARRELNFSSRHSRNRARYAANADFPLSTVTNCRGVTIRQPSMRRSGKRCLASPVTK